MLASTEVDNDRTRTGQEDAQAKKERSARLKSLYLQLTEPAHPLIIQGMSCRRCRRPADSSPT